MSNYRRLISYIYAYEGGVKGKNIGFAKLEVRNDQCKLSVNVKKVYVGSNNMGVYLLAGKREVFLGNIFIRSGAGEFRAIVQSGNVENTGTTIDECYGLTIHEVENAWQSYTTIWEDAVARTAQIDLADVTSEKQMEKDMTRENITAISQTAPSFPMSAVAEIEREIEQNEQAAGVVHNPSPEEMASAPEIQQAETGPAAEMLTEMTPIPDDTGNGAPCVSSPEKPMVLEGIASVPYECIKAGKRIRAKIPDSADREEAVQESTAQESTAQESTAQESTAQESTAQESLAKPEEPQTGQSVFNSGFLNRLAALAAERYKNRPIMEEMNRITGRAGQEEESSSVQAPANQNLETAQEIRPETPPHITNQAPPHLYIGDPAELEALEQEEKEGSNHEKLWEYFKKVHTKMPAFDYEHGCEIVTIKPQDIGILPRETWVYGNNSFLLHGYYNYRYLILAKLFNPEGKPRYLLGIPGHYYSNEKYMASMFGFPNFVLAKQQPAEDGRFGFWYTDVRLGD